MKKITSLLFLVVLTITGQGQITSFHDEFSNFSVRHYKYMNNETLNFPIKEFGSGQTTDFRTAISKLPKKPTLIVCISISQTENFGISQIDSLVSLHKDNYNLLFLSLDEYNDNTDPIALNYTPEKGSFATLKDIKNYIYEQKSAWIKYPFYSTDFITFNNLLSYGISYAYLILDEQKKPFHFIQISSPENYLYARDMAGYMQNYLPVNTFRNDTIFYTGYLRTATKAKADEYVISKPNRTKDTIQYRFYATKTNKEIGSVSLDIFSNTLNGPIIFYNDKQKKTFEGYLIRNGFAYIKKWDDNGTLRVDIKGFGDILAKMTLNGSDAARIANKFDEQDVKFPEATLYNEQAKKMLYYRYDNSGQGTLVEKEEWREDGTLKEAVKNGITYTYHPNGKPATVISYNSEGKRNGIYKKFTPDGILISIGNYVNDKREGRFEDYSNDGKPLLIADYSMDKKNGTYQSFHKNGKPLQKGDYILGEPNGKNITYYENGGVLKEVTYNKGNETGLKIEYYENGKIKQRSVKTDNNQQMEYYYENGNLFWKTDGWRNNPRNDEYIYYPDGRKWALIKFRDGNANCSTSVFYDRNGNIINHKTDFAKTVLNMLNDPQVAAIFNIETNASEDDLLNVFSRSYKNSVEDLLLIHLNINRGLPCN